MGSNELYTNKMKIMNYSIEHQVAAIGYEVIAALALLAAPCDRFSARLTATLADTHTMPPRNLLQSKILNFKRNRKR